jgi:hypothetical protein
MQRHGWHVPASIVILSVVIAVLALSGRGHASARLVRLSLDSPNSYDYVPAIAWDRDASLWRAWWCALDPISRTGDAILTATSENRINWSTPAVALRAVPGTWEGQHVCDPTVLHYPAGEWGRAGWRWVMYYNGGIGDGGNRVAVALSHDGRVWTRFHKNPIKECGSAGYGCGHFSAIAVDREFRFTYVIQTPQAAGIRRTRSFDGWHFVDDEPWDVCGGCTPGLDILYDPTAPFRFLGVYTDNAHEQLVGAEEWGAPWRKLDRATSIRSYGSGFFRDGRGWRRGAIWSAFGTPPFGDISSDFGVQKMHAIEWRLPARQM